MAIPVAFLPIKDSRQSRRGSGSAAPRMVEPQTNCVRLY